MVGGAAVGVAGGLAIVPLVRRLPLPSPALYPLRLLAAAGVIYGAATLVHGSGFLAVFVAGVLVGDRQLPHRAAIDGVLSSLGSLAEITMFVALGLTIDLTDVLDGDAWFQGLVLAALLAFVIRPVVVGGLLLPVRLDHGERLFVMWSGLKGAVPILLAALALIGGVDDGEAIYSIVFVVVLFSVLVQGTFVPAVAHRLRVPMKRVDTNQS
jgi:cell volume regulation protein A